MSQSPWMRRPRKYLDHSVLASSIMRRVKQWSLLNPGTRMFPAASFANSTLALTTCEKFDIWKQSQCFEKKLLHNSKRSPTFPKNPAPFFSLSGEVGAEIVLLDCPGATPPSEHDVLHPPDAPSWRSAVWPLLPRSLSSPVSPLCWYLQIIKSIPLNTVQTKSSDIFE